MLTVRVEIGHMGEQEACPLTDTEVEEELGGKEYQRVQSCFGSGPMRDERGSYQ
jgi:hypothetical protein